jgi:hypothetical protein
VSIWNALRCVVGNHKWITSQVLVETPDCSPTYFVIAWRQCERCAKSRLVHILGDGK